MYRIPSQLFPPTRPWKEDRDGDRECIHFYPLVKLYFIKEYPHESRYSMDKTIMFGKEGVKYLPTDILNSINKKIK